MLDIANILAQWPNSIQVGKLNLTSRECVTTFSWLYSYYTLPLLSDIALASPPSPNLYNPLLAYTLNIEICSDLG